MAGSAVECGFGELGIAIAAIAAQDGQLNRLLGFGQVSYRFPLSKGLYFSAAEPVVRYEYLYSSLPNMIDDPLTWDRRLLALAVITTLSTGVTLKCEYYVTMEKTEGLLRTTMNSYCNWK